jgi:hypothetical protein
MADDSNHYSFLFLDRSSLFVNMGGSQSGSTISTGMTIKELLGDSFVDHNKASVAAPSTDLYDHPYSHIPLLLLPLIVTLDHRFVVGGGCRVLLYFSAHCMYLCQSNDHLLLSNHSNVHYLLLIDCAFCCIVC